MPVGAPRPRLLVPEVTPAADQRGPFVRVVAPDGTVEARKVQPGTGREGDLIVIDRGVGPDDRIVVNGLQPRPGQRVQAEPGPAAGAERKDLRGPTPRPDQAPPVAPPIGRPPGTAPAGNAPNS